MSLDSTDLGEPCADLLLYQSAVTLEFILVASQPTEVLFETVGECALYTETNGRLGETVAEKEGARLSSPFPSRSARQEPAASEAASRHHHQ